MFERDSLQPTMFSDHPRQCVPVSVVMYNRVGSLTDAVDLRLAADDHERCSRTESPVASDGDGDGHGDMSVVVGQAGHRRVVVSQFEKALANNVDAATTSEHQQTTRRTVLFCQSGTVTKITINNDREASDIETPSVDDVNRLASQVNSPSATSSLTSPDDRKTAVLLPSTETAAVTSATPTRSQYSYLIRRRKKTQSTTTVNSRERTQSTSRAATDLPSPPQPKADDTPMTLLQYQKTLVSDITKHLSAELSSITSFLRVTKPAYIDDRERVAMQSMQRIKSAFQRLTPACLTYRRFCSSTGVAKSALPGVDALRLHDSTLRRCRDKLKASFNERRDVILQTPIAGEQRLFTFVWLQRHSTAIIDCINVVIDVIEAIRLPSISCVQTSSGGQPATSNDFLLDADDVKPNISRLEEECGSRLGGYVELADDARPPSLIPAIKTDIVAAVDEPPILQPCIGPRLDESENNARLFRQPSVTTATQRQHSHDDDRVSVIPRVNSSSPGRLVASVARSLAVKQEQPENISTAESSIMSLETVPAADASVTLDRSQLADHFARSAIVNDTSGQIYSAELYIYTP